MNFKGMHVRKDLQFTVYQKYTTKPFLFSSFLDAGFIFQPLASVERREISAQPWPLKHFSA